MKKYIAYYILNNNYDIQNISRGTAQKVISKNQLSKIKIKIPKDLIIIENLEIFFLEIDNLKIDLYNNEKLYKLKIQELFNDFN
jgi:restriction endonuclease S subunit